jgi:hypothetical protein
MAFSFASASMASQNAASLRVRAQYSSSTGLPMATSRCSMHQMGVTPMPPATSTERPAPSCSLKLLRGAEIGSVMPTRSCWCT